MINYNHPPPVLDWPLCDTTNLFATRKHYWSKKWNLNIQYIIGLPCYFQFIINFGGWRLTLAYPSILALENVQINISYAIGRNMGYLGLKTKVNLFKSMQTWIGIMVAMQYGAGTKQNTIS